MDFVKIMWISDLLENSVFNGYLLVFFFLISGFVFLLFLFKTHLDLNSCDVN